ncbi:MAG: hypothetical protein IGS48_18825 [Oscillatoriales cyanobacterium C42_A2020_001]|nr:hypothetical protein [Leptolyngbyaceae cyanobacterium C42_A2020_001]
MIARKLSDPEKETILRLYRTTGETSSTLAVRYGVSTSTVSRILKSTLPADEYEALIQQKRGMRTAEPVAEETEESGDRAVSAVPAALDDSETQPELPEEVPTTAVREEPPAPPERAKPILRRSRRRSGTQSDDLDTDNEQLEVPLSASEPAAEANVEPDDFAEGEVLKEILSESLIETDEEELSGDLDDDLDDLDDDEDDEDDEDDGDLSDKPLLARNRLKDGIAVQILPLSDAPIPRTFYLVVDRAAELIAPPLQEFGDLGEIPEEEFQAKTLPIFDNHRIAKRYSNPRTQRVIKLPDGRVLSKTSSHLQAKGITRLLIDGRVYSLT